MKRIFKALLICALSLMFLVSCSRGSKSSGTTSQHPDDQPYEQTNTMMDTVITLKAYGTNAKTAVDESFKRLDEIDKLASTTISTSDVYKINAAAGKEYVKVHPEIIKMIETSIKYSKLSGGAFDITTGPIINLWGIGTHRAQDRKAWKIVRLFSNLIPVCRDEHHLPTKKFGIEKGASHYAFETFCDTPLTLHL